MSQNFDPADAVEFFLDRGRVKLRRSSDRLLVPADALAALCDAAGADATAEFGEAIGEALGMSIASRAQKSGASGQQAVRATSVADLVDMFGGELALLGLGTVSIERWGKAMVLVLDENPQGAMGDSLFEAVAASALSVATGREVEIVRLERAGARARFLICSAVAAKSVRAWMTEGQGWGDIVVRLHSEDSTPPDAKEGGTS